MAAKKKRRGKKHSVATSGIHVSGDLSPEDNNKIVMYKGKVKSNKTGGGGKVKLEPVKKADWDLHKKLTFTKF